MKSLGFTTENKDLGMHGAIFKSSEMLSIEDFNLPTPSDPAVVRAMVSRGQMVFLVIFVLSCVGMPLLLFACGTTVLWITGNQICGTSFVVASLR